MKYIVWNYDLKEFENGVGRNPCNAGDTAMVIAQRKIIEEVVSDDEQIIELSTDELFSYSGELAVCPICVCTDAMRGRDLADLPSNIIPAFISLSINSKTLSLKQSRFYKMHEPIGCRDEQTLYLLQANKITAYLVGCMATTIFKRNKKLGKKILFVDVPKGVLPYVPNELKCDIEFLQQEVRLEDLPNGISSRDFGLSIFEKYKRDAKMVVTSRFHGGVIALGLGIPVIIVNENYTYRFSFLKKLLPFYTRSTFKNIDWYPEALDFEKSKKRMMNIAINKLKYIVDLNSECLVQESVLKMNKFEEAELIDYYDDAIEFIEHKWEKDDRVDYAIWGVNNNAAHIVDYFSMNYPNAHLKKIYDKFRTIEFRGLVSDSPEMIKKSDKYFIFVTTFVAAYNAIEFFQKKGIDNNCFFLCKREYIKQNDICVTR